MQTHLSTTNRTSACTSLSWLLAVLSITSALLFVTTNAEGCIRGPPVVKGKRFFDASGKYIPIKGVAYYPRPNAGELALSNSVDYFVPKYKDLWQADIENFKRLGVNVIRIYGVDPGGDHDAFMCALQAAGIYVIVGLLADCENCGILGDQPAPGCYPPTLKYRGQYIINRFSKYDNVLAFSAGNEVALYARRYSGDTALNAPCQKQFIRDMRQYVDSCVNDENSRMRKIPIGVVTMDRDRDLNALYYSCRTDPSDELEEVEWYGLNAYQHCDHQADGIEDLGGYKRMRRDFIDYNLNVPVIIAEFGCRGPFFPKVGDFEAQREWLQVDALFSQRYTQVFAGGVAFEYSAEKTVVETSDENQPWPYYGYMKRNHGIGYLGPIDCNHDNIPCSYTPYPEFDTLAAKFNAVDASFVPDLNDYVPPNNPLPQCPTEFAAIGGFQWVSETEADHWCPPVFESNFVCESVAPECAPFGQSQPDPSPAPTLLTTKTPTLPPVPFDEPIVTTAAPTPGPAPTPVSTESPTPPPLETAETAAPTPSPEPTPVPTLRPTKAPFEVLPFEFVPESSVGLVGLSKAVQSVTLLSAVLLGFLL